MCRAYRGFLLARPVPRSAISFALALVLIGALGGAGVRVARAKPASAPAAAPVWTVDKAASRLTFRVTAGDNSFDGVFKAWDAQIAFDPANLKASRAVVSIALSSAVTGDPVRDQRLPKADGFDVAHFPKATFETVAIAAAGPGRYLAEGDLSIHGVKHRIEMPFSLTIARDLAHMDGTAVVQSADFGLARAETEGRGAEVTVKVRLTARKAH
jgi:polyisoprenoid-binding protein YceI